MIETVEIIEDRADQQNKMPQLVESLLRKVNPLEKTVKQ